MPVDASATDDAPVIDAPVDGTSAFAIEPPVIRVPAGRMQIFVANAPATWSVMEPNGGAIDAAGWYVAPDVPGTYHITANGGTDIAIATVVVDQMYLSVVTGGIGGAGNADGMGNEARFTSPSGTAYDGAGTLFVADDTLVRAIDLATGSVTTLAGGGIGPDPDGVGEAAQFVFASALAYDPTTRTLYVSDTTENTIRAIDVPTRTVTTVAGTGFGPYVDGPGAAARFGRIGGLCVSGTRLYIADAVGHTIRTLDTTSPTHDVATLAGQPHVSGFSDATDPSIAMFSRPSALACTPTTVYVADYDNAAIRTIDRASGAVGTLVGSPTAIYGDGDFATAGLGLPWSIAADPATGMLYVASGGHYVIRALDLTAHAVTTLPPTGSLLPNGLTVAGTTLWFSDPNEYVVRKVDLGSNLVTIIAGTSRAPSGSADGDLAHASFFGTWALAIDRATGNVLVSQDYAIRTISLATGQVTTLASQPSWGIAVDGAPGVARLGETWELLVDPQGTLWQSGPSDAIRVIGGDGSMMTRFGQLDQAGAADGIGTSAQFSLPAAMVWVNGKLIVADENNATIRSLDVATGAVSTIAGAPGVHASVDGIGTGARFQYPYSLATDGVSTLWIGDRCEHGFTIRALDLATSSVTTIAGDPMVQEMDDGIGAAAHFVVGRSMVYDGVHSLYVADSGDDFWGYEATIRRIWLPSHAVSTYAGRARRWGAQVGPLQTATLAYPLGITLTPSGDLLFTGENAIFTISAE